MVSSFRLDGRGNVDDVPMRHLVRHVKKNILSEKSQLAYSVAYPADELI